MIHFLKRLPKQYVVLLVLLVTLPVGVMLVQKTTLFKTNAATAINLEAENATLVGEVNVGMDTSASGGKYIEFSPSSGGHPSLTFQPSPPYYATFFYMWYKNPNTDNSWSYWTDLGKNPPSTWFSHYLPDPRPNEFNPSYELYSSNNYEIFKWQASKLAEAKQEVAIASWWGQATREDTAFNNIINSFMGRGDNPYPNLRWAVYYEDEGFEDPAVSTLVSDLQYLNQKYMQSPYYLKINNKPVVFVYAGNTDNPGTMVSRWSQAKAQIGGNLYVVLKVFSGFGSVASQSDSWHQYAPATRSGQHGSYSSYVSPGFWLDGQTERLVRDSSAFETAVKNMVLSSTTWKLIETWNEWGEGTSVEPGIAVRTNTSGVDEPNPNGYAFGNLYVDILNRNLPALEKGSGR